MNMQQNEDKKRDSEAAPFFIDLTAYPIKGELTAA